MSWKDAKDVATAWLAGLDLPQDLKGREIDLEAITRGLAIRGSFRAMVLRAVARQLKSRGAKIKNK